MEDLEQDAFRFRASIESSDLDLDEEDEVGDDDEVEGDDMGPHYVECDDDDEPLPSHTGQYRASI